jgi:hypothetical protein
MASINNRASYYPGAATASHSFNLTIGSGTKRKAVLAVSANSTATASAPLFDGNAMTQDVSVVPSGNLKLYVWSFNIPDATPSGAYALAFTTSGATVRFSGYGFEIINAATAAAESTNSVNGTTAALTPSLTSTESAALILVAVNNAPTQNWTTLTGDAGNLQVGNETDLTSAAGDGSTVAAGTRTATLTAASAGESKGVTLVSYAHDAGGGGGSSIAAISSGYHTRNINR